MSQNRGARVRQLGTALSVTWLGLALLVASGEAATVGYQKGDGKGSVSETDDATVHEGNPTTNYGTVVTCNVDRSANPPPERLCVYHLLGDPGMRMR